MGEEGNWKDTLPEEIKDHPALGKYETVEDLAKGLVNAQDLIGRKGIIPPGEKATDEDRARFLEGLKPHQDLIRQELFKPPETPEAYELPEVKTPEGLGFAESYVDNFKQAAHKLGLTKEQAAGLWSTLGEASKSNYEEYAAQIEAKTAETEAALKKEWGEQYDANVERARRVVAAFGGEELADYLEQSGLGNHPALVKFMAAVGEKLSEDELVTTPPGSYGETLTEEKLRAMMRDPRYWDHARRDMDFVKKVEEGFKKLYPGTAETAVLDRRRP
ncbi:MAG: hypothetical protein JRI97_07725, partial [Deltaproteobacteria bacterium]|nr:hypothetical protein [Deltaproteobacteria bacterium]